MRVFFLHHSAVLICFDKAVLIFDYYTPQPDAEKGKAIGSAIKGRKNVYVFVSHSHSDHFDPCIFGWDKLNQNITYILDDTVTDVHKYAVVLKRDDEFSDGYIKVKEFGSTDIGGSFYVECEGKRIYHAGDFNYWHWRDDGDEKYSRQMKLYFDRELKFLRSGVKSVDIAFFPVDKRMGSGFDEGADIFIEKMEPEVFVPIHFLSFEDTKEFKKKHNKNKTTKVLSVKKNGQRLI